MFGMPLWYNDILRLQLNRQWYGNGISLVGDILNENAEMLELEYLQSSLGLMINFIQYGELKANMNTLKNHYQLNRDPTLFYPNKRPINSL